MEFRMRSEAISAGRLILATGVRDQLPTVPRLAEHWVVASFIIRINKAMR